MGVFFRGGRWDWADVGELGGEWAGESVLGRVAWGEWAGESEGGED